MSAILQGAAATANSLTLKPDFYVANPIHTESCIAASEFPQIGGPILGSLYEGSYDFRSILGALILGNSLLNPDSASISGGCQRTEGDVQGGIWRVGLPRPRCQASSLRQQKPSGALGYRAYDFRTKVQALAWKVQEP